MIQKFSVVLLVLLGMFLLYKLLAYNLQLKMKRQLEMGTLEEFKQKLGREAHHRGLKNGIKRYRWRKGLVTIKASFGPDGRIVSKKMKPFNFFSLQSEIVFLD